MRNKAPLSLMEQLVMLLVFAIAGALCLRVFVTADKLSRQYCAQDSAVLCAQSAAEKLKNGTLIEYLESSGAKFENDVWTLGYDEQFMPSAQNEENFILSFCYEESQSKFLWRAKISITDTSGKLIFEISVTGQTDGRRVSAYE